MMAHIEPDRSRDFICPCSKSYFSYAALFTHIKQKHNGKPPGQIIKPKPEHKRGRPRKAPQTGQTMGESKQNGEAVSGSAGESPPAANLNQIGNNIKFITGPVVLRSSPGSQFKSYRADSAQHPTLHELPAETAPELSLLQDLTSNLVRLSPLKSHADALTKIQAGKLLAAGGAGELVECLSEFICFCKDGLKEETAAQIQLLVTVLLQHVLEQRGDLATLKHIHLNDHIQSFFDRLQGYAQRWQLREEPIFQGLNPMKILVVLYNWINSVYSQPPFKADPTSNVCIEQSVSLGQSASISDEQGESDSEEDMSVSS